MNMILISFVQLLFTVEKLTEVWDEKVHFYMPSHIYEPIYFNCIVVIKHHSSVQHDTSFKYHDLSTYLCSLCVQFGAVLIAARFHSWSVGSS